MDENIQELLKATRLFASLDEPTLKRILPKFSKIELQPGETLFHQGDPSDSVYLFVSGKLLAELVNAAGECRVIGTIQPGETVGELGALSNEPRTLSIKSVKDSILLKLPAKIFVELCYRNPAVMFATVRPIISRSRNIIQMLATQKKNKHVVIIAANPSVSLEGFVETLTGFVEKFASILLVSDYQSEFCNDKEEFSLVKERVQLLAKNKKSSQRVLYVLKSCKSPLARVAFQKADMVFIVAHHDSKPRIDQAILDKIQRRRIYLLSDPALVLLYPEKTLYPESAALWLSQTDFSLHHNVRMNNANDFQRLVRFMRGKAVGVVLSGGGTRGWSHLGAIKALLEMNIPIDIIGGTSVGALVAASYAINENFEEAHKKFYKIVVDSRRSISWRSLTWPVISLFDAEFFTKALMDVFGDIRIENLWLPYFCVSCNLANTTEDIHRDGLIWQKIRASASIPGLIPPMLLNGELHLDGGLLNNLPVDIMRQFVGSKGKIVAVELNSFAPDRRKYVFPPILTFKDIICSKLGITDKKYKFPRFVDTFLRGVFVGSLLKAKQNSLAANIFISLNLGKYRLLHSNPHQADGLIDIGYQEALKQLNL